MNSSLYPPGIGNAMLRRLLEATGCDMTMATARRRCVVVAPHADDETLGCGVTIMRKRDCGTPVRIVIVSDGSGSHPPSLIDPMRLVRQRADEAKEACRRLGVESHAVELLGFPEGRLGDCVEAIRDRMVAILEADCPTEVFVPSGLDSHADHRAVFDALCAARSRCSRPFSLFEYPVWCWHPRWWRGWIRRRLFPALVHRDGGAARALLVRTDPYLDRKRWALEAHGTQVRRPEGVPQWAVLGDVADGRFLASFFRRYEVFIQFEPVRDRGDS